MSNNDTFVKSKVIALEGLIGIGKSTLCNVMVQAFPTSVDIYREETNEKFLQLFYKNPAKYGFAMQWGMLKSRLYQAKLANQDAKHGRLVPKKVMFWDRSVVGDYIFALWNHLLGSLSVEEMDVYETELGASIKQPSDFETLLKNVHLYVYLQDEPANCKNRVEYGRQNVSEQAIPLEYYQGLDDIHFHILVNILLMHKLAKVCIKRWSTYDNAEQCMGEFLDAIDTLHKLPSVTLVSNIPHDLSPQQRVYRSADDILQAYDDIKCNEPDWDGAKTMSLYRQVFVPRNVMQIDPKTKGINLEHLAAFTDINFYQNEYKRVVLFHLSCGQNVHFYDLVK